MINKQWIFVLKADGYGSIKLNNSPKGWDEQKVSIKRSPSYWGLNRNISTSLQFVKEGWEYIKNIYDKEGVEFEIEIGIYQYNQRPIDKYLLFFTGLLDLSTYNINETYVTCDINESSLARKIMSRDDVSVNLINPYSIENVLLPDYPALDINLHEREILLTGNYTIDPGQTNITSTIGAINPSVSGLTVPLYIASKNIDNLITSPYGSVDSLSSVFYEKSDIDYKINLKLVMSGYLHNGPSGISNTRNIAFRIYDNDALTTFTDYIVFTTNAAYNTQVDFNIDTSFEVTVLSTQRIALIVYSNQNDYYEAQFDSIDLQVEQNLFANNSTAKGHLIFEAAQRICESISDTPNILKSNLFGRTDLGYAENGPSAFRSIHSGKQIRKIPNAFPSLSLKDFFDSLNSIDNIGLGIEYNEVNQPYIRIEKKEHFFSGEVAATIYNVKDLNKEVANELRFNQSEVGYAKSEYEEVNGLDEYNNKFSHTTCIRTTKNKLDLVSKIRADGHGIEFARRTSYLTDPTTDTKYDNDNFIIVVKWDGSKYVSVKDENYDFVENIFSPETAYNLDLSPGRMLRNSGDILRAGLEKNLDNEIVFNYAEQKPDMRSQKTGESVIDENENIDPNTLNSPRWVPEFYTFESTLTRELLDTLTRNSNKIVKFSTESQDKTKHFYYGWIWDVSSNPESKEATFKLLRVNTSSPDVVLVDPEGLPDITTPITEETIFSVFGGGFEFVFTNGGTTSENIRLLEDDGNRLLEDGTNRLIE